MRELLGQLRVRFAVVGFVAIYAPVVILLIVLAATGIAVSEEINDISADDGGTGGGVTETTTNGSLDWPALLVTAVVLALAAAWLAWWLAGRALRPVQNAAALQDELIEELSHELRTPLAVLSTNADVLLDHPEPTVALYRTGLERSQGAAQRMSTTIDELLVDARSRTRTIERQPTDVCDVVRRVVAELHPLAAANDVAVTTVGADDRPVTAAIDRQSVERALTNLVTNAIDIGPTGSAVTVAISSTADTVAMTVSDEGPGIAEADQAKVFERYWRADEESQGGDGRGGHGIGLSIVRHVATAHGGSVTVRSPIADGAGTEFRFELAR